jgi:hypothetical protein
VIKQYSPSSDELSRTVNRGRGAGKKADGATEGKEEASSDAVAESGDADRPESESHFSSSCRSIWEFHRKCLTMDSLPALSQAFFDIRVHISRRGENGYNPVFCCTVLSVRRGASPRGGLTDKKGRDTSKAKEGRAR